MPLTYDKIEKQPTLLLSEKPYLPYGDVALVYGRGSLGKGRMVMSVVADVTRGNPVGLDKAADDPGDVVVILPEDKPGEQVRERLEAAGADLTRVFDLTRLDSGVRLKFSAKPGAPGDLPVLAAFIAQLQRSCLCGHVAASREELGFHLEANPYHAPRNPRMVVIDPITAVIGEGTIQTNNGARAFVEPLQDLADATGVCILAVAHPNKAGVLQGSGALSDALRLVYFVDRDRVNGSHRVLRPLKANNLPPRLAGDLKFTIADDEQGRPRVIWLDRAAIDTTAADWRAARLAEKALQNQVAAMNAALGAPSPPGAPGTPWRVLRWDKPAGGGDVKSVVGDKGTQFEALVLAKDAAGRLLQWKQKDGQMVAVTTDGAGGTSVFLVYDRTAASVAA